MNVLVVEDEKKIASFIEKGLSEQGFTVDVSHHGDEGFELAMSGRYDVIALDIMLPGRDGLSLLSNLRGSRIETPIILLTARSALDERVAGLNLGADDYLTKPFYVEELVARVHALIRRATGDPKNVLVVGELRLDRLTREVWHADKPVRLTTREFNLLEYLLRLPGRVLTRTQILEHVWGYHFDPSTNLVDVHIQRIRKKLDVSKESPIETVRGVGYRIRKP